MLLTDQVEVLRGNIAELRNQQLSLPLMGGLEDTRRTYRFKSLVHPARDIATMIRAADPGGDKLPVHLRGWDLDITDEYRKRQRIELKRLLGMIIHVYYLRVGDGKLDVSNDQGKRIIVPYSAFLDSVERLVLTPGDICLVICGLAENELRKMNPLEAPAMAETPGLGNLAYSLLASIGRWPGLQEIVWATWFAHQSTPVEADCKP